MGFCEDRFLRHMTQVEEVHLDETIDDSWSEVFRYSLDQLKEKKSKGGGGLSIPILDFVINGNFSVDEYEHFRESYNSAASGSSRKRVVFNLMRARANPIALDAYQQCIEYPRVDYQIENDDQDEFQITLTYKKGSTGNGRITLFQDAVLKNGLAATGDALLVRGTELEDGQAQTFYFNRDRRQRGTIRLNFTDRVPSLFLTVAPDVAPLTTREIAIPPATLDRFVPRHTGGDDDFDDSVDAAVSVELEISQDQKELLATIDMDAEEHGGDTKAKGTKAYVLYRSEGKILSIESPKVTHASVSIWWPRGSVVLNEQTVKEMREKVAFGGISVADSHRLKLEDKGSLVQEYTIFASDGTGHDAGRFTAVIVKLHEVKIMVQS